LGEGGSLSLVSANHGSFTQGLAPASCWDRVTVTSGGFNRGSGVVVREKIYTRPLYDLIAGQAYTVSYSMNSMSDLRGNPLLATTNGTVVVLTLTLILILILTLTLILTK